MRFETDFIQINLQLFAEEKTEEATLTRSRRYGKKVRYVRAATSTLLVLVAFYTLMCFFMKDLLKPVQVYYFSLNDGVLMPLSQETWDIFY